MVGMLVKLLGGNIIGKVFKAGTKIVKRKFDYQENLDELDARHDIEAVKAGKGSWKDEFLVLLFCAPLWAVIFGALWEAFESGTPDGWFLAAQKMVDEFNSIDGQYAIVIYTIVAAVFGRGVYKIAQGTQASKRLTHRAKQQTDKTKRP